MATHISDLKTHDAGGDSLVPATRTSTANGTGVDLLTAQGNVQALLSVGTVSGTSPTLDVKLQESDDNSTFTDISGATFTQVTASTAREWLVTDKRAKRYVRAVATIAGTTPSFACYCTIISQKKISGSGDGAYVGF